MATAFLSPIGNGQQFFNDQGVPLAGGFIYTYLAGTTTPAATYTTSNLSVPNANPIQLNSAGRPPQEIWFPPGTTYKFFITDSNNNPLSVSTYDNLTGINNVPSSNASEWVSSGITPTYVGATSFTLPGNQTVNFPPGRRIQASVSAGTVYGTISTSVFTTLTTITVEMDGTQVLDNGLSAVNYGFLNSQNFSLPPVTPIPVAETGSYSIQFADWSRRITVNNTGAQTLPASASLPDGWKVRVNNISTLSSPKAITVITQGSDTVDADAATTVYVLPGETVVFEKFGTNKFYTQGRTQKGRIINVSQFYADAGSVSASTSLVSAQSSVFTYQPISPLSKFRLDWEFQGLITNLNTINTTGTFQIFETTSGNVGLFSGYILSAFTGSGGIGAEAPLTITGADLLNNALTGRSFALFQATNNAGANVSATAIKAIITEIQNG